MNALVRPPLNVDELTRKYMLLFAGFSFETYMERFKRVIGRKIRNALYHEGYTHHLKYIDPNGLSYVLLWVL